MKAVVSRARQSTDRKRKKQEMQDTPAKYGAFPRLELSLSPPEKSLPAAVRAIVAKILLLESSSAMPSAIIGGERNHGFW